MVVNRQTPTIATHPSGLDGEQYSNEVAEEILQLWNLASTPVTIDSGTNDLVATSDVPFLALSRGNTIFFSPLLSNTGSVTINVDLLGVKSLLTASGNALTPGLIQSGTIYTARYDGVSWRLSPDVPDMGSLISGYSDKLVPVPQDLVVISDSEDGNISKSINIRS